MLTTQEDESSVKFQIRCGRTVITVGMMGLLTGEFSEYLLER